MTITLQTQDETCHVQDVLLKSFVPIFPSQRVIVTYNFGYFKVIGQTKYYFFMENVVHTKHEVHRFISF